MDRGKVARQHRVVWEKKFNELVLYKEKNGNCNVPQSQGRLGRWVHDQRTNYTKGKLSRERTTQLEGVGFNWGIKDKPWEESFDELVVYKEKNGNCNMPRSQGALGRWVNKQRRNCKKGKLSQERITQLEGVGFVWQSNLCQRKPSTHL